MRYELYSSARWTSTRMSDITHHHCQDPPCGCEVWSPYSLSSSSFRMVAHRVIVLVADLNIRVLTDDGKLLRELTLDPTRNDQRRMDV